MLLLLGSKPDSREAGLGPPGSGKTRSLAWESSGGTCCVILGNLLVPLGFDFSQPERLLG